MRLPWFEKRPQSSDSAAQRAYERVALLDPVSLSGAQLRLRAIGDLRQEVHSDGFSGYFFYSYGDLAPVALEFMREFLGQPSADLLLEAMDIVGDPFPTDYLARQPILLDETIGGPSDRLNTLDQRFYDLEASIDVDGVLNGFVRDNNLRA